MPTIVWIFGSLMIAAIAAAFAFALQLAETKRRLQHAENDLAVALADQAALNKKKDQEKADIQTMADTRINELTQTISDLQPDVETEPNVSHAAVLLDEIKLNILKLLSSHDELKFTDLISLLSLQSQTAKYHLEELKKLNMVSIQQTRRLTETKFSDYWRLEQPGRTYLHDNGLL